MLPCKFYWYEDFFEVKSKARDVVQTSDCRSQGPGATMCSQRRGPFWRRHYCDSVSNVGTNVSLMSQVYMHTSVDTRLKCVTCIYTCPVGYNRNIVSTFFFPQGGNNNKILNGTVFSFLEHNLTLL